MNHSSDEGSTSTAGAGMAVFDICDTLYFSNTTHDFIAFVVAKTGKGRPKHWLANSKYLPFRYLLIAIGRHLGVDPLRAFNVGLLKGYARTELHELARQFVRDFLAKRRIENVHELLTGSHAAGRLVILCSTSIEPVVAEIAKEVGIDKFFGSELEYAAEVCTGRIADDVGDSKLERLKELCADHDLELAVSDNRGDLKLLKAAARPLAVVHARRKESFWRENNIETLHPKA